MIFIAMELRMILGAASISQRQEKLKKLIVLSSSIKKVKLFRYINTSQHDLKQENYKLRPRPSDD